MATIDTMTEWQRDQMAVYAKRWIEIGLCTEPADRPRAEAGVRKAYQIAGLEPPREIVWMQSPVQIMDELLKRDAVEGAVRGAVRDAVEGAVGGAVWGAVRGAVEGQFEAPWLAFYAYFHDVYALHAETEKLEGLWEIAQSANWYFPYAKVCFICERPRVIALDSDGRLHQANGAAVEYRDGWGVYAWHGLRVPKELITEPITLEQIENERNAEIRRMMMERYGYDRYIQDTNAVKVSEDSFGILWRKELTGDEPVVMVQVKDPSTDRQYFLRVPPSTKTPHEAIAWTFDMSPKLYNPKFES